MTRFIVRMQLLLQHHVLGLHQVGGLGQAADEGLHLGRRALVAQLVPGGGQLLAVAGVGALGVLDRFRHRGESA